MADAVEFDVVNEGSASLAKDLFSGAMGGIAQVLIGQPFDIVKVRLQTSTQYSSALDAATKIASKEGPLAFYKGTLMPLVGIGACVSVQFGAFNFARRHFESFNTTRRGVAQLSYSQFYLAGAFAGVTNTVLSTPIEHVRIRLQTQPHVSSPAERLYKGPLDAIGKLNRYAGVGHGLYRGTAVTLLREAQAYGCWFLTYEYLMNADVARRNLSSRKEVESYRLAFYGGCAGEMLWLSSYPFDVIKSRMQTDGLLREKAYDALKKRDEKLAKQLRETKYKNMRDAFGKVYRSEGIMGFWKGIGPTLLRAMPVSAATFFVAETTLRLIT